MPSRFLLSLLVLPLLASQAFASGEEAVVIPFELAEGLISVQASVNGVEGRYLVDSGAPTIMFNRAALPDGAVDVRPLPHKMPLGAGGAMVGVEIANDLTLSWGGLEITGQRGLVADLSHLSANVGVDITGLIGFEALKDFEVHFDYAASQLTLVPLDDAGQPVTEIAGPPDRVVELEMTAHIPTVPARVGGQDLRLGIDSGAAGGVLSRNLQEPMAGQYEFLGEGVLTGGDTAVQTADKVRFDRTEVAGLEYRDLSFQFGDIGGSDGHAMLFSGLLGYHFLAAHHTAINFRSRQLKVWLSES